MLVSGINWSCNWVQVITITGTYTCPMEERDDDFYFRHSHLDFCTYEFGDF